MSASHSGMSAPWPHSSRPWRKSLKVCIFTRAVHFSWAYVRVDLRLLHRRGWVHCDISPGNIILVDGLPKLNDFEYARHKSNAAPHEMLVSGIDATV